MTKLARQEKIRQLVYEQDQASVADLCERLEVSEATIRRDLEELAAEGVIQPKNLLLKPQPS
jgi:DeoR/GlpR family transcriptional regulator of sugar metabolism